MPFLDPVYLLVVNDYFEVIRDVRYQGRDEVFMIHAGRRTDLGTVPRVARWLIDRFGRYTKAFILHDELCEAPTVSARDVDGLLRRVLREGGAPWLERWLVWTGVRWGAAVNPSRWHHWWRDLPRMLPLTLLAVAIMLPAAIGIAYGLILFHVFQWVTRWMR